MIESIINVFSSPFKALGVGAPDQRSVDMSAIQRRCDGDGVGMEIQMRWG